MCPFRHGDEHDGIDSSSDGSNGGGSSDSDGSSEEEESGDGDARYRKNPGMLMMVRQGAPDFAVDGSNNSGARVLNEVCRLSRHRGFHSPMRYSMLCLPHVPLLALTPTHRSSCPHEGTASESMGLRAYEQHDVTLIISALKAQDAA